QLHVHQHDVGPQLPYLPDGLGTVGGFADHLDAGLRPEDDPEAGAHQFLVVREDDTDMLGHDDPPPGAATVVRGKVARTRNPPPGRGPASSSPSCTATRSRMPSRPNPCLPPVVVPVPSSVTSISSDVAR